VRRGEVWGSGPVRIARTGAKALGVYAYEVSMRMCSVYSRPPSIPPMSSELSALIISSPSHDADPSCTSSRSFSTPARAILRLLVYTEPSVCQLPGEITREESTSDAPLVSCCNQATCKQLVSNWTGNDITLSHPFSSLNLRPVGHIALCRSFGTGTSGKVC